MIVILADCTPNRLTSVLLAQHESRYSPCITLRLYSSGLGRADRRGVEVSPLSQARPTQSSLSNASMYIQWRDLPLPQLVGSLLSQTRLFSPPELRFMDARRVREEPSRGWLSARGDSLSSCQPAACFFSSTSIARGRISSDSRQSHLVSTL